MLLKFTVAAVLMGAISAHADWVPDAIEAPIATRHLVHNDRLNNHTPGVALQWDTSFDVLSSHVMRTHFGLFRNSNGDPTVYLGVHAEWHVSGPLFAGGGIGGTYGYKDLRYNGNAWLDGVLFQDGAVIGRRYESRKFKPAAQLDGRLELNKHVSLTAHFIVDDKMCRRTPAALHVTSCALVLGVRGAW